MLIESSNNVEQLYDRISSVQEKVEFFTAPVKWAINFVKSIFKGIGHFIASTCLFF